MTRGRELAGAAGTMRMTEDKIPQQEWVSRDVSGGLRRQAHHHQNKNADLTLRSLQSGMYLGRQCQQEIWDGEAVGAERESAPSKQGLLPCQAAKGGPRRESVQRSVS